MSAVWIGKGIYYKLRQEDGKPYRQYFYRQTIDGKVRVFKAGRTEDSADKLRVKVLNNPAAAVEKRERAADDARNGLSVEQLYKSFTGTYRSRGGTDYYVDVLARLSEEMGKVRVSDLTPARFDAYFRMRRTEVGESTIRKECIAAAKMLKWGRQRGLCTARPLDDYDKPKEPAGAAVRALTYDEEDKVLALLPQTERDVVAWGLDSGMRRSEILGLSWRSHDGAWAIVNRAAGIVNVSRSKTGQGRVIPLSLSDRLSQILDRHPERTTTALVFHDDEGKPLDVDRLNGTIESAMKSAGVPKVKGALWNVLRKTWVSRIYDNGARPQDEAAWAGHSTTIAEKHYRDMSSDTKERAAGLLNRPVARGVAGNRQSA